MDDPSTPPPRPATAPPRLGTPENPIETHSGRQVLMVMGSMVVFFIALTLLAMWGAKNG
jgi:hypothetical protein